VHHSARCGLSKIRHIPGRGSITSIAGARTVRVIRSATKMARWCDEISVTALANAAPVTGIVQNLD
jgi:hypothetical protein